MICSRSDRFFRVKHVAMGSPIDAECRIYGSGNYVITDLDNAMSPVL